MHIIHVLTRLLRAGAEENTIATAIWQAQAGHEVTLIHGHTYDSWWETNLPQGIRRVVVPQLVHRISPMQDTRALSVLRNLFRDLQPDVIHTHQSKAGVLGRLAAPVVPQATVVHGIHIVPFEGVNPAKRALYITMEKMAAAHTDLFISVSDATGQAYVDAGIAPADKVHCARSGMALETFAQADIPADWRSLLRLSDTDSRPPVAVMMAAFEPRKQHLAFVKSLAQVVDSIPDLRILLAGDGLERARVEAEVARLDLQDNVIFCGHRSDPEALFALADVSVLTSIREGLPQVVVQSIAAGCPVVAQDLPGLSEILQNGRNSLIASAGDTEGAVASLIELLQAPEWLRRLKHGAQQTDVSAWALGVLGARTVALYGREPVLLPKPAIERANVA